MAVSYSTWQEVDSEYSIIHELRLAYGIRLGWYSLTKTDMNQAHLTQKKTSDNEDFWHPKCGAT